MTPRHPDPSKTYRGVGRYNENAIREARDVGILPKATAPQDLDEDETRARTVRVAILDPKQDPNRPVGQTHRASVNRHVDVLENELSHKRISPGAWYVGRVVQGVFERAHLGGASTWAEGSRVDTSRAKEMAIVRKLLNARTIRAHLKWMRDILGEKDAEIVRQVIGENRRYGNVELPGEKVRGRLARAVFEHAQLREPRLLPEVIKDISYIAHRFRDALETLAASRKEPPEG
jgi:hypothetical protein